MGDRWVHRNPAHVHSFPLDNQSELDYSTSRVISKGLKNVTLLM
jgi:hypothetical protein